MGMYKARPGQVNGDPIRLYTDEMRSGRAADGIGFEEVAPAGGAITPPSGETVLFSDDFNRTNVGADWTSEIQNSGNEVSISNNKLILDFSDGGGGASVWLDKFFSEDSLKISYDLKVTNDNDGNAGYGNFWNMTESNGDAVNIGSRAGNFDLYADLKGYYVQMKKGGHIGIREYLACGQDDDCRVALGNEHAPIEVGTTYQVDIVQQGSEINTFINDELWWSATDASPRPSGNFAFRLFRGKYEIDNFKIVRLGESSDTPPDPGNDDVDTYQAEDANVGGNNTSIDNDHNGYNGTGFVNFAENGGMVLPKA